MGKLDKFLGLAAKALGDKPESSRSGGTDWGGLVRGAADALGGDRREPQPPTGAGAGGTPRPGVTPPARPGMTPPPSAGDAADRAAVARYDYLMRTADPHQIEQVHHEAFARLTPAQRAQVEAGMQAELPPHERPRSADAADLARAGARAEATRPGVLRGLLARAGGPRRGGRGALGGAVAAGGLAAGGVLAAVAGGAIVSSIAGPLLEQAAGWGVDFDALAQGVDLEAIAQGVDVGALAPEGLGTAVEDAASGFGEQATGFGEQLADGFGLGDFFGR